MADVFISYARQDVAVARRVAKALQGRGHDVWWDAQLPAHRAYSEMIEQNLRVAKAVVVLWSTNSTGSQWVRAEADLARAEGKLVQAKLDGSMPPMPFNQIQCAELSGWRGHRHNAGWQKLLASVEALIAGEPPPLHAESQAPSRAGVPRRRLLVGLVAVLLLAAAATFLAVRYLMPAAQGPTMLAVLPFKTLSPGDENLSYGIWEDTRQALSRNPQLTVIGRQTAEAIAGDEIEPKQLRSKLGIDYLLDGTLRRAGDRVRVSVSLVQTKDGAQVWSETLDRKLDDVFALQSHIAREIEGRIRGRLASGGGVMPQNIATSGDVYLLYNEARTVIRKRNSSNYPEARRKLERAVKIDPNFAPAWATLSVAVHLERPEMFESGWTGREAEAHARRAITLAPNLAAGHAALGLALGRTGPVAEAALRRANRLDPSDFESIHWLASLESSRGRWREALDLYDRAIKIEPLFWPAVLSRLGLLLDQAQTAAIDGELARLNDLGDARLATQAHMLVLSFRGDDSEAVKRALAFHRRGSEEDRDAVRDSIAATLLRLGYVDEAFQFSSAPPQAPFMWRNDPKGLEVLEARKIPPPAFWKLAPMTEVASRAYANTGRQSRLVELYRAAAASPDELLALVEHPLRFVHLAPILALALRQEGDEAEAQRLAAAVNRILSQRSTNGLSAREQAVYTARLRALQGRMPEAMAALRQAGEHGWLPEAPLFNPVLEEDPVLALLKDMPEFQQMRRRILAHLARERRELGPLPID